MLLKTFIYKQFLPSLGHSSTYFFQHLFYVFGLIKHIYVACTNVVFGFCKLFVLLYLHRGGFSIYSVPRRGQNTQDKPILLASILGTLLTDLNFKFFVFHFNNFAINIIPLKYFFLFLLTLFLYECPTFITTQGGF